MYRKYLDIHYKKNGRDFEFCDCYGICYLYNKHELEKLIPIYLNEEIETPNQVDALFNKKKSEFKKIKIGKEHEGDIISLNIKGLPTHVGVVLQKGLMLHIMNGHCALIESYNNSKWINRIDSFWRYESTL